MGGVLVRCHGRVWKRNSARGTRQANKQNVVVEVEPFVFECSRRREVTRRDIDKLNVVVDALTIVTMNHASSAERNEVAYMRNRASNAERNKAAYMREDRCEYRTTKASLELRNTAANQGFTGVKNRR